MTADGAAEADAGCGMRERRAPWEVMLCCVADSIFFLKCWIPECFYNLKIFLTNCQINFDIAMDIKALNLLGNHRLRQPEPGGAQAQDDGAT